MKLDFETYSDKVHGGWIGKCAGGILGAPIEGIKAFNNIPLTDDLFAVNYPNDDLDLQLLWLDMVKQYGPNVRETDFAAHWQNHVGFPWNEYGIATRNIKCGLLPPLSGMHNNYYWNASMGCPIRSEIWGMLCAGNPVMAASYARMDASVDHHGFSVEAEQFLSACAAIAFFENDIPTIFITALQLFDEDSLIAKLVKDLMKWAVDCSYATAMGKIKSGWGDADFTSAPMNVGFTLLALLHKGKDFNGIMDALHMGHDSDCIVATAGALIGIIMGYERIPAKWKTLVGNEVLISSEITGIVAPPTIKALTEQTCKAAIPFLRKNNSLMLTGDWPEPYKLLQKEFHFFSQIEEGNYSFEYENLTSETQEVAVEINGANIDSKNNNRTFTAKPFKKIKDNTSLYLQEINREYTSTIRVNKVIQKEIQQAIPSYGCWLLLGPFIEHDVVRMAHHKEYPEHGLSTLPSVDYMNHDALDMNTDFIDKGNLQQYLDEKNWNSFPFNVQIVFPADFRIELSKYYYGKGERVVYLISFIEVGEDCTQWFSIGSTAPFQCSVNGLLLYEKKLVSRAWIGDNVFLVQLKKGKNEVLLKVGLITDDNIFEIGIKEFTGKHPHQEQWSLLVPNSKA